MSTRDEEKGEVGSVSGDKNRGLASSRPCFILIVSTVLCKLHLDFSIPPASTSPGLGIVSKKKKKKEIIRETANKSNHHSPFHSSA